MLAGGIDTDTVLLLMGMSNLWMSGMLWGAKRSENGTSNYFPHRTSGRKIVEDHFAALDAQPLLQDEVTETARADPVEENVPVDTDLQLEAQQRENPWDEECAYDIDSNEDIPDDIEARIEKLILLHRNRYRNVKYVQDLKEKGVDGTNLGMRLLTNIVDKHDRKLKRYWEKGVV
ncbi:hypothetical protein BJ165DRAFT_1458052 [Panaeolus papilionaceus]|nr:hypothetical protein BJ165DRAFT_1458052 [Panaeolus papilionaceus]